MYIHHELYPSPPDQWQDISNIPEISLMTFQANIPPAKAKPLFLLLAL